jgi:ketosteroid isomerase-like protein
MSQENLDIARRGYEAFAAGDAATFLMFLDPRIVVHDFPELPDTGEHYGTEGFLEVVGNVLEQFDEFRLEPTSFTAPDDDHVLVTVRTVGRGKESGAWVEADVAHLWRVRDGQAVELWLNGSADEALQAAGLLKDRAG